MPFYSTMKAPLSKSTSWPSVEGGGDGSSSNPGTMARHDRAVVKDAVLCRGLLFRHTLVVKVFVVSLFLLAASKRRNRYGQVLLSCTARARLPDKWYNTSLP